MSMCNNASSHPLLALKAIYSLAIRFLFSKNQAIIVAMIRSMVLDRHGGKDIGRYATMKGVFLVFGIDTTMASFQE